LGILQVEPVCVYICKKVLVGNKYKSNQFVYIFVKKVLVGNKYKSNQFVYIFVKKVLVGNKYKSQDIIILADTFIK